MNTFFLMAAVNNVPYLLTYLIIETHFALTSNQ